VVEIEEPGLLAKEGRRIILFKARRAEVLPRSGENAAPFKF
jgi:hypothetical protein